MTSLFIDYGLLMDYSGTYWYDYLEGKWIGSGFESSIILGRLLAIVKDGFFLRSEDYTDLMAAC
jgi:hypothetical protein